MKRFLILIFFLVISGCASFQTGGNENDKISLPDMSNIRRSLKPSVTIEFIYKNNGMTISGDTSEYRDERRIWLDNFKKSELFSRIVQWKRSGIFLDIELIKKGGKPQLGWKTVSELSFYLIPNFYTTEYELKATVFDEIHKKAKEYRIKNRIINIEHLSLALISPFFLPEDVDIKARRKLYDSLLKQMYKDGIVGEVKNKSFEK